MNPDQEPKYGIRGEQLFNRQSGELIPEDEPLMIFRGRDVHVVKMLSYYVNMCSNEDHKIALMHRMAHFMKFAEDNPDRMKEPDTVVVHSGKNPEAEVIETEDTGDARLSVLPWGEDKVPR